MLQLEEFYQVLLWAERKAPEQDPDSTRNVKGTLETVIFEAAELIAKTLDLKSLSGIRAYKNIDDYRIAEAMINEFVDQCDDQDDIDYVRLWGELGMTKVLNAPVETPAEFSEWLLAAHRERIEGSPCVRCSKPVHYSDAVSWSETELDGSVGYMHHRCYDVAHNERLEHRRRLLHLPSDA